MQPWPRAQTKVLRGGENDSDAAADQISDQRRQALNLIVAPPVFDREVLTLDIAGVLEALAESAQRLGVRIG